MSLFINSCNVIIIKYILKILFVCGCIEPGKDGVGDYTNKLSGNLISGGNEVKIIALYDEYISGAVEQSMDSGGVLIPVLRLSRNMTSEERFSQAKDMIMKFNPDWISLQFVPFAFQPKGLPFNLGKSLLRISRGINLHIMFHELWLGMHKGVSKKELLWGWVQRKIIIRMVAVLKPKLIHTQSNLYKSQLKNEGIEAGLLPLFSNITLSSGFENLDKYKSKGLRFILFGKIHNTGAPVAEFAKEVKSYSEKTGVPASLIIMGRCGEEQNNWVRAWEENNMEVEVLGELPDVDISLQMLKSDFGITTTVYGKIEKSGSVVAMLEHGLKVICVAGPWQASALFKLEHNSGVFEYTDGNLAQIIQSEIICTQFLKLEEVSQSLITSFEMLK